MRPAVKLWTDRRSEPNGHRNLQIRTVEHQAWPVLWCLHTPQKCSNARPNIARSCQHQHRPRKRGNNSFPLPWGKFPSVVVESSVCALDVRKSPRALIDQSETEVRHCSLRGRFQETHIASSPRRESLPVLCGQMDHTGNSAQKQRKMLK